MITNYLRTAILISLGAHIVAMSAVQIITPQDVLTMKPYTRVDFLGPILQKTAFDIMLENVSPDMRTAYGHDFPLSESGYLDVAVSKKGARLEFFPDQLESRMDDGVMDHLRGAKIVPDVGLGFLRDGAALTDWKSGIMGEDRSRGILYRPPAPVIMPGLYGDEKIYRLRVTALVDKEGNVSKAEVLTTTGYPRLDMIASKYVMGWIFEPKERYEASGEEWCDVEVLLDTTDGR